MNPSKGGEKLISFPTFRHILGIKNEKNLSKMKQYKRLVRFTVSPWFNRYGKRFGFVIKGVLILFFMKNNCTILKFGTMKIMSTPDRIIYSNISKVYSNRKKQNKKLSKSKKK